MPSERGGVPGATEEEQGCLCRVRQAANRVTDHLLGSRHSPCFSFNPAASPERAIPGAELGFKPWASEPVLLTLCLLVHTQD